ncbi:class I SAM-dependent DNA methyltransferase [Sinorhizobium meliloti]|uniref:HsdM family class I SAM-dependent methyltransferase n=1 Tax=Rhizobium meliloti TaxID=382 RepID=UPI0013E371C8|nr:N-6 DNA methylase [Sinorhizobium meliloti]
MNELTFAGWLAEFTALRADRKTQAGEDVLIGAAAIEERQMDEAGAVRRCDIRFNTAKGRKLASGELKRPEVAEGRDPRNENLRHDARRKALARGLPYYFTCNMAKVVLYEVATSRDRDDEEIGEFELAPITNSSQAAAYKSRMEEGWARFLDEMEARLVAVSRTRPSVTTDGVIALRDAIFAIADEARSRVARRLLADPTLADQIASEALQSFNFSATLDRRFPAKFEEEVTQILRFGAFVIAQKLVLYRVLEDAGPRRPDPFHLDALVIAPQSTDPKAVSDTLENAFSLAIRRSGDFETAFLPRPFVDLLFTDALGIEETRDCRVGEVWSRLQGAVNDASWISISQNIVGLLYEVIVEERFRHQLGQFYTPEDVVDFLVSFAVREPNDVVLDPATGGGSFLRAAYQRKRELGSSHDGSLATIWGCEITAFAAELSTITLATSDTHQAAAYPRVLLRDFFSISPGLETELEIPGASGRLIIPQQFDAVVGNPPYISYRRIDNGTEIMRALVRDQGITLPKFSGKSDAYLWFIVHATQFLRNGGRLSFVVSSAMLFSDYGIPLIRFLGHHFKIVAVVDSIVERWFAEADTNAVLLLLERESDEEVRSANLIRFVRLRRRLTQIIAPPQSQERRGSIEDFLEEMIASDGRVEDPRMQVNIVPQGKEGGLALIADAVEADLLEDEDE